MENNLYKLLRKDIENKFGKEVLYAKDCDLLAKEINKKIKRQISGSTLKRFFGIVKSGFKPSKYTLDTLSQFLGYTDWNTFTKDNTESYSSYSTKDTWSKLSKNIAFITNHSLNSLKQKTNYNTKKFFLRDFAKQRFEAFIDSPKNVLMFVAPDGYGKSSMLIQLAEHYFLNENAKYRHDLVGFLDGEAFFSLYSKNTLIPLLNQFLDFKINASVGLYFENHPEQRKGRIVGIIDNVDEIYSDKGNFNRLVENIKKIILANNHHWFKLILTCRPENLTPFINELDKSPVFKKCWYNPDFNDDNMANAINIPLFEKEEIETYLQKYQLGIDYEHIIMHHNNILNFISYPYLLFLFLDEHNYGKKDVTEISLLNSYVKRKLISFPYYEEKISLIDRFIELSFWGKESYAVRKNTLLANEKHVLAYCDLMSKGILYEYTDSGKLLENNTYTKFSQSTIFEFLLFEKWRLKRKMDLNLFFKISDYYVKNNQLRCNLLNFFSRTLIYNNNFKVIKQLHIEFEKRISPVDSHAQIPPCLNTLSLVVKEAIHSNSRFKDELTPWISHSELGKLLYC